MILYRFIIFVIIAFGGYLIYRVATDAWRKTSVDDKIDDVDEDEAKNNRDDIDNF